MAEAAAAAAAAIRARLSAAGRLKAPGEAGLLGEAPLVAHPPPPPVLTAGGVPAADDGTTAELQINDISSGARTILTRGPKQEEVSWSRNGVVCQSATSSIIRFFHNTVPPRHTPLQVLKILCECRMGLCEMRELCFVIYLPSIFCIVVMRPRSHNMPPHRSAL